MIVTEKLTKVYKEGAEVRALQDVDLEIDRGEVVVVMGPSGSGKSTLLNLIGTLDVPTSGRVLIEGKNIGTLSSNQLSELRHEKIGFVFQFFNLVPILTALENVVLPCIPYMEEPQTKLEERARYLLELVGMSHRLDHLPSQLSGGEQQRVAIARALINAPAIILADEPTGNIDTRAGDEIMELMMSVRDYWEGTAVIVTHSPRVAAFAERAYFLKDGAVVDQGRLDGEERLEDMWRRLSID